VNGTLRFRALDVGRVFSCGVTTDGAAYCWGANDVGQLGRPDAPETCGWPDGLDRPCATEPVPVASALTFDSVAVGTDHTCALAADGGVHCWGRNDAGQLGDGSVEDAFSPQPAAGAGPFTWVTAGDRHGCALDLEGGAWCWGDNTFGALGTDAALESCGGAPCGRRPVPVATTLRFQSLSASRGRGGAHTCGLATDGLAYCWGSNARGQLGTGAVDGGGATPRVVTGQLE
jgi:alpha-tubulin suppressor-like RCC1 family protein